MPAAEASPVASSESDLIKMDDRKRAAAYDNNDSAPPLKKQATSVNGGSKPHPDADMPWKDDLDVSCPGGLGNPPLPPVLVALVGIQQCHTKLFIGWTLN